MQEQEIFVQMKQAMIPYVKNPGMLKKAGPKTNIFDDLRVNSARVVDLIIDLEEGFGIRISDAEADRMETLEDALDIIKKKLH